MSVLFYNFIIGFMTQALIKENFMAIGIICVFISNITLHYGVFKII